MRWQVSFAMHLVLLPVVAAEVNFGPQNCVSLSKTEQGTCMIKTNCDGIDTSSFDFAFVCLTRSGDKETQVKHEYGKGGFDADEDYDTDVHCDECLSEPKVEGSVDGLNDAHAQLQQYSSGAATSAQTPPPKAAAFYGPGGCIAAYRSGEGTCIVQTRCTSQSQAGLMKEYNYGLTCVDNTGDSTRHLFGKNSFDAEETFDTLVECKLCLGLDGLLFLHGLLLRLPIGLEELGQRVIRRVVPALCVRVRFPSHRILCRPGRGLRLLCILLLL